ncbi:hypothetical protein OG234_13410 [Streptomyces sp. NBC_01420]|uniref:hypothetical protein n=1 Tax=Streptomyces sp. NBC_01420 TaxID=2903858 RepID=UPI0032549006
MTAQEGPVSYTYRCAQCRTTSPRVIDYRLVLAERDTHRARFHGGHIPDGESITARQTQSWAEAGSLERGLTVALVLVVLLVIAYKTL